MSAVSPQAPLLRDVMLVDGSERSRTTLASAMEKRGYRVVACKSAGEALRAAQDCSPDFIVTELRLPDDCGLKLLSLLKIAAPHVTLVMLTGHASIATAIEAIKRGATNYLIKPASADQIVAAFSRHGQPPPPRTNKLLSPRSLEWEYINWVVMEYDGNISAAARALSMHRRTLQRKLSKRSTSASEAHRATRAAYEQAAAKRGTAVES